MERELTKASTSWVNGTGDNKNKTGNLKKTSLNDLANMDDGNAYDQFANKKSTYSENLYTSARPDMKAISHQQHQEAERVSREILNQDSHGNVHLAEERGQVY